MEQGKGREVAIALLPEEWNIVFQGVGQLPYLQVAPLMQKLSEAMRNAVQAEPPKE